MIVSCVPDGAEIKHLGVNMDEELANRDEHEYQTASELFELMAKNNHFQPNDEALSTTDLVLLYKNIDIGTQLMSTAKEGKTQKPNQYVETVVYEDPDSEESDLCENLSNEDLHNVAAFNNETLDLFSDKSSVDNKLCHKYGNTEMSSWCTDYNDKKIFKDLINKEQIKKLRLSNNLSGQLVPSSLLDYIRCKSLEDNYNVYMDNVIIYIKHTIEQLKRISNGDYLTERAKEKWYEVKSERKKNFESDTKVLAKSTSIPVYGERSFTCKTSIWHDLVQSEVDIRTLSKTLEKKIVIEVPKIISGTFRLFSNTNLSFSYKKRRSNRPKDKKETQLGLVVKLNISDSGIIINKVNSIMHLETSSLKPEIRLHQPLPIAYKSLQYYDDQGTLLNTENQKSDVAENNEVTCDIRLNSSDNSRFQSVKNEMTVEFISDHTLKEELQNTICTSYDETKKAINTNSYSCDVNLGSIDSLESFYDADAKEWFKDKDDTREHVSNNSLKKKFEESDEAFQDELIAMTAEECRYAIQQSNVSGPLIEEIVDEVAVNERKQSSTTKMRIKSPYENKSHVIDERKRKRLLAIRERREKRKMAIAENNKRKPYHGNAQTSHSVTKLSITNKSFYTSIYGQNLKWDGKKSERGRITKFDMDADLLAYVEDDSNFAFTPGGDKNKLENRCNYMDDDVTEVISEMKENLKAESDTSLSSISDVENLNLLRCLIASSDTQCDEKQSPIIQRSSRSNPMKVRDRAIPRININKKQNYFNNKKPSAITNNLNCEPLLNTRKRNSPADTVDKAFVQKNYDFIENDEVPESFGAKAPMTNFKNSSVKTDSFTVQGTDSGTSLKHRPLSSNPSNFSTIKPINIKPSKKSAIPTLVIPKVVISSKLQTKPEEERLKKERKRIVPNMSENPLKAISQLLSEIDNVQKSRQKSSEPKMVRRFEADTKQRPRKHLRVDQQNKSEVLATKTLPLTPNRANRATHTENYFERKESPKKNIVDIIDEVKEAKGEAVRGPSKLHSRLDALAQPKKTYVQAHSEEYQEKYGRNLMADRLQKMAAKSASEKSRGRTFRESTITSPANKMHPLPSEIPARRQPLPVPLPSPTRPRELLIPKCTAAQETHYIRSKQSAVESYITQHYGSVSSATDELLTTSVSLTPNDVLGTAILPSSSIEESTVIDINVPKMVCNIIENSKKDLTRNINKKELTKDNIPEKLVDDNLSNGNYDVKTNHSIIPFSPKEELTVIDINVHKMVCNIMDNTEKDLTSNINKEESTKDNVPEKLVDDNLSNGNDDVKIYHSITSKNSSIELERLETALYRKMSLSAFQKRLRMKNLTLTPKQSLQHMLLLQSGDASSILRKTFSSIKLTTSHEEIEKPISKSKINVSFAAFPMLVETVGYAAVLPKQNQTHKNKVMTDLINLNDTMKDYRSPIELNKLFSDKTNHSYKGKQVEQCLDCASQFDLNHSIPNTINLTNSTDKSTVKENQTNDNPVEISTKVEFTNSLDILVGLLNEIQKITTCQTHITNSLENEQSNIENATKSSVVLPDNNGLGAKTSLYSFYMSNKDNRSTSSTVIFTDHSTSTSENAVEPNVKKLYANAFTDVPSQLLKDVVNHSTSVSETVLVNNLSNQTIVSVHDYNRFYSKSSFNEVKNDDLEKKIFNKNHINNKEGVKQMPKSKDFDFISEFETVINVKRDILVTLYSILVITVFAALSFPELTYLTNLLILNKSL